MNVLLSKLKEVMYSVLPITAIVLVLNFTLVHLDGPLLKSFLLGAVLVIAGLTIFLLGVDIGITPIGNNMGAALAKTNKLWIVAMAGLALGFFISIAEPDLHILAGQVELVTGGAISKIIIVAIVSVGIAVMLSLGLVRIVYNIPLYKMLIVLYSIIFVIALFTSREFLAISFDASGATTGALTVPFILALALGVSSMKKDSEASESDSFGLVAVASTGAIISVMIMSLFSKNDITSAGLEESDAVLTFALQKVASIAFESLMALLPILLIFLICQKAVFKMSRRSLRKILVGIAFTFVGLVLFLTGINAGFMNVGTVIGRSIASLENKAYLIVIGLVLGLVTILAEPAVYVLTHQIEDVTSGYIKRSSVMLTLSIGVGIAVALSMVRIIVPEIQLWHYLLPGYLIALAMTFFVPKLFVGIAFDSGGVASGPMTATFILAFSNGAASAIEGGSVMSDGFGVIAMVALTPLIALQALGLIYKIKAKKEGVENGNEQF